MLLGDDDSEFPKALTTMIKYFSGFKALSVPINHSLSVWNPVYQVGYKIALLLSEFRVPNVLYASLAFFSD